MGNDTTIVWLYLRKDSNMVLDKIHAIIQDKVFKKRAEIIKLKWQKVELEKQLRVLKAEKNNERSSLE